MKALLKDFDVKAVRKDFPSLLQYNPKGQPIVYLDNSATTQKPQCVIDALVDFYTNYNANVHRGYYAWGQQATEAYENTRKRLASFLGATDPKEIVFTRGATEALNALADIIGQRYFHLGDEIILSELEHHANQIPWQMQQAKRGVTIKGWQVNKDGELELSQLDKLLTQKTKLLAFTHVSNVIGTVPPLREIIDRAHANGTMVVIDASQAIAHLPVDVQALDCDFLVGSGHKMYAPMGSGFFYGKRALLESLPPYHGGGTMMETVSIDSFTPAEIPARFEAGTPPIADIIGFGAAIKYLQQFSWESLMSYEDQVIAYAEKTLSQIPKIHLIGHPHRRVAVVSFLVEGIHPHDVAGLLCDENIALRAGFHCCQPLMHRLQCPSGVLRASFGMYNTCEEIDRLAQALKKVFKIFS